MTVESTGAVDDTLRKIHIETTSLCNLDCPMCVRHGWEEPTGHMPLARFSRILDGLTDDLRATTLAFSGFGEPLMNPAWHEMMTASRGCGHRLELITNGLLIDRPTALELAELGVEQIAVSLDNLDARGYARMRGVPSEGAVAAVHNLLDARCYVRHPMTIGVAAVATRGTVGGLPALLDWASELRLDFVSISNLVPHTEEMAREILWERASWASVFRQESWRPRLTLGRMDASELTQPLAAAVWTQGLTYPSPSIDDLRWRNRCRFAHEGVCAVAWDGRVAPCLSLLHTHTEYINGQARRVLEHVVGHVDEHTVRAIWQQASFKAFRERLRAFDFPPCFHCGGCPLTETNREDCYLNPAPVCGECLWAQGIVLCP